MNAPLSKREIGNAPAPRPNERPHVQLGPDTQGEPNAATFARSGCTVRHLPDGRGRGAEGIVPENTAADRRSATKTSPQRSPASYFKKERAPSPFQDLGLPCGDSPTQALLGYSFWREPLAETTRNSKDRSMSTHRKRPRDPAQLAKLMVDIATGQIEDRPPTPEEQDKDPSAIERGRCPSRNSPRICCGKLSSHIPVRSASAPPCTARLCPASSSFRADRSARSKG